MGDNEKDANVDAKRTEKKWKPEVCVPHERQNVQVLDVRIRYIRQFMPDVFSHKLRTSVELNDYKYTKLRQILLYTG